MHLIRQSATVGLPPGTPIYVGPERETEVVLSALDYDEDECELIESLSLDDLRRFRSTEMPTWINVNGIHNVDVIQAMGDIFELHPLVIEDIANAGQRPKVEDYGGYLFFALKLLTIEPGTSHLKSEHVSLVLGDQFLLSFHESDTPLFEELRASIETSRGSLRRHGVDYLAYRLLDVAVDHYFVVLETLGEQVEALEEEVMENPSQRIVHQAQSIKRSLLVLRRSVWPLREVVNNLLRGDTSLVSEDVHLYFRDVYDHIVEVMEVLEANLGTLAGLHDLYLSGVNNRMSEVMKSLTIIATVFMPLSFLAGVWGMNFQHMPELAKPWGYPFALATMIATALSMLVYLRRRQWL